MTVARILAQKGRSVTTAQPHATLTEVIAVLAAKHIGALIIADASGTMLGVASERDIVRAIADHGPDALNDPISHVMTKAVVAAAEEDGVIEIAQKMTAGRFRHMPVLKDGRIVGIVSVGDAIKYRLEQMEQEQSALREYIATA